MSQLIFNGRYYRLFPPESFLGYAEEQLELDTSATAFLVVDVYGLGFSPDDEDDPHPYPSLSLEQSKEIEKRVVVDHIKPALDAARQAGLPIIYVNNSAPRIQINRSELGKIARRSDDLDWEAWGSEKDVDPREYVLGDSTALRFSKVISPQTTDYFIRKHAYSGFYETRLDSLLRNLGIKSLVCVGFALDMCLGYTLVDAINRNYQVVLLRDCTLAMEMPWELPERSFTKRMTLWMEYAVGHTVDSKDFIDACKRLS